jgi:glycosyl transferase family 25
MNNIKELLNDVNISLYKLMKPIDKIYYINLQHRTDRKEHIEQQIQKYLDPTLSITQRFNAIYNENGSLGCTLSHLGVIEDCIKNNYNNVLILEDDFEFIIDNNKFRNYLNVFFNNFKDFDILLLGVNGPRFDNQTDFFRAYNSLSTSGYILNKKIFTKFKAICDESVYGLTNNGPASSYAIDVVWQNLQRNDNVYTFPERVGKQKEGYSDISKQYINHGV